MKLFSDSVQDTSVENHKQIIASTSKSHQYQEIARDIFKDDPDPEIQAFVASNPSPFAKSIENYITS